jgi:uncharacterized protein YjbJ (UPF0337 family)
MLGILQKKYGYAKERAEKELSEFTEALGATKSHGCC